MAQNITFDLADTPIPSGIMKIQCIADITNLPYLTGTTFTWTTTYLTCPDSLFTTELRIGAKIYFLGDTDGKEHTATVVNIISDLIVEIDLLYVGFQTALLVKALLSVPTENLIFQMDEQVEKVDVKMGMYEYQNFTMEFADDYSYFPSGFWYYLFRKTAGKDIKFFIRITENGVDSFVIFGKVNLTSVEFNELALNADPPTGNRIRTVIVEIISGLDLLKNVTMADLLTEINLHTISGTVRKYLGVTTTYSSTFVKFTDVIASMVALAFNQTFNSAYTIVRNNDIQFAVIDAPDQMGTTFYNYDDYYMYAGAGGYLESISAINFGVLYPTAFELLQSITQSFGLVPRHFYGQADGTYLGDGSDKHRIELTTRGLSQSLITPLGSIIDSNQNNFSPYMVNNLKVNLKQFSNVENFFANTSLKPDSADVIEVNRSSVPTPDPYQNIKFDLTYGNDFIGVTDIDGTFTPPLLYQIFIYQFTLSSGVYNGHYCNGVKYWDYLAKAWSATITSIGNEVGILATSRYYFYKFKGQATYTRTYSDVRSNDGSTTSQQHTQCLRRHTIEDEFSTRTFYAIEVKKSFTKNTAQITWFEE